MRSIGEKRRRTKAKEWLEDGEVELQSEATQSQVAQLSHASSSHESRIVLRETELAHHDAAHLPLQLEDSREYKWQNRFPKGWYDLPADASTHIEREYNNGNLYANFMQLRCKKNNLWHNYLISFQTMTQQNQENGRIREVRRVPQDSDNA